MPSTNIGIEFENSIRKFLAEIGFADVPPWGENRETFELGGQEIDAFGRFDDLYIVVDAKTRGSARNRGGGTQNELDRITGYMRRVQNGIRERFEELHGFRDCVFIFWTKGKRLLERHKRQARDAGIALRDYFDLKCYKKAFDTLENQEIVRDGFLKDLSIQLGRDVFIQGTDLGPQAIRTRVGNKIFYTLLLQVKDLLKLAYVFRIETNNILQSYQRLLKRDKINKIRTYLEEGGFFANNILVATDENLDFQTDNLRVAAAVGTLTLPNKPCYLEIIDGQHRLLAYSNMRTLQQVCLNVTIIQGLSEIERARLFAIVNREQTKVPSYLLWDLYAIIEQQSIRGKISKFVQQLNRNGPFRDLIKLPRERSLNAYLSFTNFCGSLFKRTGLYRKYGDEPAFFNVLKAFFEVIQDDEVLGEDWNRSKVKKGRRGFVCTNNAIAIQLYVLSMILKHRDENEVAFPTQENIQTEWKEFLRRNVVRPFLEFLNEHLDADNTEDPFGSLRKETSNEGARGDAADFIFDRIQF